MEVLRDVAFALVEDFDLIPCCAKYQRTEAVGGDFIMSCVLSGLDPKPCELPMARLKSR